MKNELLYNLSISNINFLIPVLWLRASEVVRDELVEKKAHDKQQNHRHLDQRHMHSQLSNSRWLKRQWGVQGTETVTDQLRTLKPGINKNCLLKYRFYFLIV